METLLPIIARNAASGQPRSLGALPDSLRASDRSRLTFVLPAILPKFLGDFIWFFAGALPSAARPRESNARTAAGRLGSRWARRQSSSAASSSSLSIICRRSIFMVPPSGVCKIENSRRPGGFLPLGSAPAELCADCRGCVQPRSEMTALPSRRISYQRLPCIRRRQRRM